MIALMRVILSSCGSAGTASGLGQLSVQTRSSRELCTATKEISTIGALSASLSSLILSIKLVECQLAR